MADPTEAEIITQLKNAIHVLEEAEKFGNANSPNLLGLIDTLDQSLEGDFSADVSSAAKQIRSRFSSALAAGEAIITPLLRTWGRQLQVPETDPQALISRIYDRLDASAQTVKERNFTFGAAVAAGGNVGTGTLDRLTKDAKNYDLEAGHAEVKTFECIRDQASGANEFEEVFEVRGRDTGTDLVQLRGSGVLTTIRNLSPRDSLLLNAGFSSKDGGTDAAPTGITSWTVTTAIANFAIERTAAKLFLSSVNDTNPGALRIEDNDTITQALSVRGTQLNPSRPYALVGAFSRDSTGCDGQLDITLGSQTATIADLTTKHASNYFLHSLPFDTNLWYENFTQDGLSVSIQLSARTAGSLLCDAIWLVPMTPINGTWFLKLPGATPAVVNDTWTVTDTCVEAVVQKWMHRVYGRYLPHAAAPTIADP